MKININYMTNRNIYIHTVRITFVLLVEWSILSWLYRAQAGTNGWIEARNNYYSKVYRLRAILTVFDSRLRPFIVAMDIVTN